MNKRFFLFFVCCVVTSLSIVASDVIVKKDGSTILAKILKVSQSEVEYKKASNLEGPTYSIPVSDILSINYENGEKDTFDSADNPNKQNANTTHNKNSHETTHEIQYTSYPYSQYDNFLTNKGLDLYQKKEDLLSKARTYKTIGGIGMFLGFGAAAAGVVCAYLGVDEIICYSLAGGGMALGCSGGITWAVGRNMQNKAKTITVASIYGKDINIKNGIILTPGVNLMAIQDMMSCKYAFGIGTLLKF